MKNCVIWLLLSLDTIAYAGANGPIIWRGANSADLSTSGLTTPGVKIPSFAKGIVESNNSGQFTQTNIWTAASQVTATCSASPCTIVGDWGGAVASITRGSTGLYTVNFTGSFWSAAPVCVVSSNRGSTTNLCIANGGATTSNQQVACNDAGIIEKDSSFSVVCVGPRS